jgi:hypothetical protein
MVRKTGTKTMGSGVRAWALDARRGSVLRSRVGWHFGRHAASSSIYKCRGALRAATPQSAPYPEERSRKASDGSEG